MQGDFFYVARVFYVDAAGVPTGTFHRRAFSHREDVDYDGGDSLRRRMLRAERARRVTCPENDFHFAYHESICACGAVS